MKRPQELPYHLRAARLRWAALAIDLDREEVIALQQIANDPGRSERSRTKAHLLLGLHHRVSIAELCERLDMDRRTLLRAGMQLTQERAFRLAKRPAVVLD